MALYELHQIDHRYNGKSVLTIDHLRIPDGGIMGLRGPNGSGKSTLLRLLGFIQRPSQGEIRFRGAKAEPFTPGIRDRIGLLPQEAYLLHRTVYDNIAYGLRIRNKVKDEQKRINQALTMVGLSPESFGPRPWYALSGGEAHRVALAARLVLRPNVLLLDEPTASVDDTSTQIIKEAVLSAHHQWGTSLIIASHDKEWLEDVCDSRLHLFRGRNLGSDPITLIYGPWTPDAANTASPITEVTKADIVARRLSDTQEFRAFAPTARPAVGTDAAAALMASHISLHSTRPAYGTGRHCLEGIVVHLHLDRPSGCLKAAVRIGDLVLPLLLPNSADASVAYLPGRSVWLTYAMSDVQWVF